jgi:hypothetical protein
MPAPGGQTNALLDELQSGLWALWPELQATPSVGQVRGVWIGEHVENVPFDLIDAPYAVIAVPDWSVGDWSPDVFSWEQPVHIYYVGRTEEDPGAETPGQDGSGIRDKLEQLAHWLEPGNQPDPLVYGQVMDVMGISTSRGLPFNQILRSKKLPLMAGRLMTKILMEH